MSIVYVGLDLGSSNFQQVALNHDGVSRVNRDFRTSEANLVKAFSDLKGEIHVHLEAAGTGALGRGGDRAAGDAGGLFTSAEQRLDRQRRRFVGRHSR